MEQQNEWLKPWFTPTQDKAFRTVVVILFVAVWVGSAVLFFTEK